MGKILPFQKPDKSKDTRGDVAMVRLGDCVYKVEVPRVRITRVSKQEEKKNQE